MEKQIHHHIMRDIATITASIILAVYVGRAEVVDLFFSKAAGADLILVFLAGFFFASVFTVAPATAAIIKLSNYQPILIIAIVGAAGAVAADYIIFKFIRDSVADDIRFLLRTKRRRLRAIFGHGILRWSVPVVGALIIASPLPDELGVAILGLDKVSNKVFLLVSYGANLVGILAIGYLSRLI